MSVVETLTFRLASGSGESAFREADGRVQTEFTYLQPGLARRTTARGGDGEWLVLTLWVSEADAEASEARARDDPAVSALLAMVDRSTVRTKRYRTLD